jgi:hypothetical protein
MELNPFKVKSRGANRFYATITVILISVFLPFKCLYEAFLSFIFDMASSYFATWKVYMEVWHMPISNQPTALEE